MRILSTLTYYHPHWTGLTVVARRLAEGLAGLGHAVTVLTSRHDPRLPTRERVDGVRVVRVPTVGRVSRTAIMPSFPAALVREVRRSDLVHIHTPMPEAALIAAVARAFRKAIVITHHGDVEMPAGLGNAAIKRAMDAVIRTAMRLSDRTVVHVGDYRDHSVFLAPVARKVDPIYPPIEVPEPQPDRVAAWRRELGLEGRPLVGFAGRFVEEKGFDFLLRAMPMVRARLPEVRFAFAGEKDIGYERFFERCRPLYEGQRDAIVELGLLPDHQQMANFYAMSDVFTLPSRTDCFAIVQVEALLSGTPLVTSDIPGAREVVRVTGAGRLVRMGDPRSIADGLLEVLEDPEGYRPKRELVREVFDPERSLVGYEALMRAILRVRGVA
jgi:glycosyltransferase involved in cell wall biosynthesis